MDIWKKVNDMRCIDADALKDGYMHMGYDPNEHSEESYMEGWCKGFNAAVDHCIGHVIHAPTIEPEPSIPISWIERYIDWLKDMDNGFANITAMNYEIMLRRWREEQNETD